MSLLQAITHFKQALNDQRQSLKQNYIEQRQVFIEQRQSLRADLEELFAEQRQSLKTFVKRCLPLRATVQKSDKTKRSSSRPR